MDSAEAFVSWMVKNRGEKPRQLSERFARYSALVRNRDLWDDRNKRAFLMTPREEFVLPRNLARAYEHAFLDIGWGVTISGPASGQGRMTNVIDVKMGEKVLEIGTGSGVSGSLPRQPDRQSLDTSRSSSRLADRTRAVYDNG
jgi:protein-L-isoaspartate(D-aspartate) O-methyltransferase